MGRSARAAAFIVFVFVVATAWYVVAANYDYGALAGTYVFKRSGEIWTLKLRKDRSFKEQVLRPGHVQEVEGSWCRIGQGRVSFSKEFLHLPGEKLSETGVAYGEFNKVLGLFVTLALDPVPGGPTMTRNWIP